MAGLSAAIVSKVSGIAPLLGAAIGSPLGGMAVSVLANAFGIDSKNIAKLERAIDSDPDSVFKIRATELQHKEELARIATRAFEIEVNDKQDARKYGYTYKHFLMFMAIFITLGFFGALFMLFFSTVNLNEVEKSMMSLLIGMLASKWQTIIDFFYGASRHHGTSKQIN